MYALYKAIKRKFTGEEEAEESSPVTNKQKTNESLNFLTPIIPNSSSTSTTEATATTSSVDTRTILPLRTIKVVVEKIEEPVVVEESKNGEGEPVIPAAPIAPTRPRTDGIDPFTLPTLTAMYTSSKLDPVNLDDEMYPYDAALNEKVVIWKGDITTLSVDAIVNAANSRLLGGGGVDGAIHRAAGEGLYDECLLLNGAETGESKITGGHDLPSLKVIHTVGPIYSRSRKSECQALLRSCYSSTLQLAVDNDCKTLAFSGISTGVYGYPIDDATRVALDVTRNFLSSPAGAKLEKVIFTVFRPIDVNSYMEITPEYFPDAPEEISEEVEGEKDVAAETKKLDLDDK